MKLSSWVLALYFRSEEGVKLVEGFERLLSDAEGEETDEECAPDEEAAESLAPEEEARLAVDACFSEVTHCVRRTLDELGWSPPSSAPEARALCERLFEHGLVVEDQDIEAFLSASEPGSTDDDGGEEHGEPDDAEVDETVDDEPAEDAELRLGAESDDSARLWAANIKAISWALHAFAPEWFAPYAFAHAFNRFEAICDEFGIALPRLPGKASYVERARYYLEVNEALQEFRNEFEMTPVGFDAFLYGFCFEQVPLDEAPELPPAERA